MNTHTVFDLTTIDKSCRTILPIMPASDLNFDDSSIYVRFIRHLRHVPTRRPEIKVLAAIQFTADILGHSDEHVAKTLVEFGLRAPRMAFPAEYLRFADRALMRKGWEVGGPSRALNDLKDHWDAIGEDKFAPFKAKYEIVEFRAFV